MGVGGGKGPIEEGLQPPHPCKENWEELYGILCENHTLSDILFEEHFSSPLNDLTSNLFNQFFVDLVNPAIETKTLFVERCHHIAEHITDVAGAEQIHFFLDLISTKADGICKRELTTVIKTFCLFGLHHLGNGNEDFVDGDAVGEINDNDAMISSIANAMLSGCESISRENVVEWIRCNSCKMVLGVHRWLEYKFLGHASHNVTGFIPLPNECSSSNLLLSPSSLWYLCCVLPSCYTYMENKFKSDSMEEGVEESEQLFTWNLLFNSNQHGLSLNRFKHKVMEYKSPTLSIIEFSSGIVIALALDEKWIDSPDKYGGTYCQLLQISPTVDEIESGPKLVYLKECGRSIPTGLLLGADTKPKVELSTDLNSAQLHYCGGGQVDDQVERMEVWGCGGVQALKYQQDVKRWEAREVEKRKKVKLPGQWDADKSILEMGGVCVDHSQRGDI